MNAVLAGEAPARCAIAAWMVGAAAASTSFAPRCMFVPSGADIQGASCVAAVSPRAQNTTPLSKSPKRLRLSSAAGVDAATESPASTGFNTTSLTGEVSRDAVALVVVTLPTVALPATTLGLTLPAAVRVTAVLMDAGALAD